MKKQYLSLLLGGVTALVLATSANAALILNGSFENPAYPLGGYTYTPSGASWDFLFGSGITHLPSDWDHGRTAPDGNQVAFIQGAGTTMSQTFAASAGTYELSYIDAGRPDFGSYGGDVTYKVLINNVAVGTFSTASGQGFALKSFNVPLVAGNNTLTFDVFSVNNLAHHGDDSAFIDNVTLTAVPEPTTMIAGALLLLPFGVTALRSIRRNGKS